MRLYIPEICVYTTCWFSLRGTAFLASVNAQECAGTTLMSILQNVFKSGFRVSRPVLKICYFGFGWLKWYGKTTLVLFSSPILSVYSYNFFLGLFTFNSSLLFKCLESGGHQIVQL